MNRRKMIPVEEFASQSDVDSEDVIAKIRAGQLLGKFENGKWLVAVDDQSDQSNNCNSTDGKPFDFWLWFPILPPIIHSLYFAFIYVSVVTSDDTEAVMAFGLFKTIDFAVWHLWRWIGEGKLSTLFWLGGFQWLTIGTLISVLILHRRDAKL